MTSAPETPTQPARRIPWLTIAIYTLSLSMYLLNGLSRLWVDEFDVLLGGRAIAEGERLYRDFFSHHMPFAYYAGAFLQRFGGDSITAKRLLWSVLLFMSVGGLHVALRKTELGRLYLVVPVLVPAVSLLLWANTILSETIAFYAIMALLLLTLFRLRTGDTSPVTPVVCGALGFMVPVTTLAYAPAAAFMLVVAFYYASRAWGLHWRRSLRWLHLAGLFALVPAVITVLYMLTGHPVLMVEQAYIYNVEYFAEYINAYQQTWQVPFYFTLPALRQITAALASLDFETRSIATGLVTATVMSLAIYAGSGRRDTAFVIGVLFILMFNPRISRLPPDTEIGFRAGPFLMFAALNMVITLHAVRHRRLSPALQYQKTAMVAFLLVWAFVAFRGTAPLLQYSADTYYRLLVREENIATRLTLHEYRIEPLVEPGEPVWTGPYVLDAYLSLPDNEIGAHMAFYMPYLALSEDLRTRLFQDLDASRPPVIYFLSSDSIGVADSAWAADMLDYLARDYFQVSDPALQFHYFRRDMSAELTARIEDAGFSSAVQVP